MEMRLGKNLDLVNSHLPGKSLLLPLHDDQLNAAEKDFVKTNYDADLRQKLGAKNGSKKIHPYWKKAAAHDASPKITYEGSGKKYVLKLENTEVTLGEYDDIASKSTSDQFAGEILNRLTTAGSWTSIAPKTLLSIVQTSPFWIDLLTYNDDPARAMGQKPGEIGWYLVIYRLNEIFLLVCQYWEEKSRELYLTGLLLARQRYRILATLDKFGKDEVLDELYEWPFLVRQARQEYAQILLEKPDDLDLALADCIGATKDGWDLDSEAHLLLADNQGKPWSFAREHHDDRLLTDRVLQKWFLAHDHLAAVTDFVADLITKPIQEPPSWLKPILVFSRAVLKCTYVSLIGSTLAAIAALLALRFAPDPFKSRIDALLEAYDAMFWLGILFLLYIIPIIVWIFLFIRSNARQKALFPLALRVPAMSVVGLLAIAGLADKYIEYAFNAWDAPFIATVFVIVSSIASFFYIFAEAGVRTRSLCAACKRALLLWLYSLSAAFWLSFWMGWASESIGIIPAAEVSVPVLKSEFINSLPGIDTFLSIDFVFIVAALSLLIGVFTQIFWEDKAIAEPL